MKTIMDKDICLDKSTINITMDLNKDLESYYFGMAIYPASCTLVIAFLFLQWSYRVSFIRYSNKD